MKEQPKPEIMALVIEAKGEIISSNFPAFADHVREHLATFNRDLVSDEDFDQADKDAKAIAAAESSLKSAKESALAEMEQLNELFAQIDGLTGELSAARLDLTKQIAKRKDEVKAELIAEYTAKLDCAPRLRAGTYGKSLLETIKGKRTLDSMRKALEVTVTIHNGTIGKNRKAIESFETTHGPGMVPDAEELETKSPDSVEGELRRRFEAKKAAEEAARLKAEAEQAKADAAAAVKQAEAAVKHSNVVPITPAPLPTPPKIGSIPVGTSSPAPLTLSNEITEDQEWAQVKQTVVAAFALIKEHRERLTHEINRERLVEFGAGVNAAWKECQMVKEVIS